MKQAYDVDVVVAGAGPVGLVLAMELRLGGVPVAVLERRTDIDTTIKAGSLNVPTGPHPPTSKRPWQAGWAYPGSEHDPASPSLELAMYGTGSMDPASTARLSRTARCWPLCPQGTLFYFQQPENSRD
jgi:choline dehydrogenase-like flavoprotein